MSFKIEKLVKILWIYFLLDIILHPKWNNNNNIKKKILVSKFLILLIKITNIW